MKNRLSYIFAAFLLFLVACVKDKSNYSYQEINDISISGIEPKYTFVMLDSINIEPTITQTLDDGSDLSYYWILYEGTKTINQADTLSKERDLKILVNVIPGNYKCTYRVINNKTGVGYRREFDISVISELQRGFLALSNLNGQANVTFISVTGDVHEDIYKNINGETAGSNPVAIRYTYRPPLDYVAILCNDSRGGVVVSSVSFKKMFEYQDYFYDPLETIKPESLEFAETYGSVMDYQVNGGRGYLINNKKLHLQELNYSVVIDGVNTTVESKFFSPFTGDYELYPIFFKTTGRELFFDMKYKRFMYIANLSKPYILPCASNTTGPFDPADIGLDMVWGKFTKSARNVYEFNSIFRDASNNTYYLKFNANDNSAPTPLKKVLIPSGFAINNATKFTGNSLEDYIYFAVGSKVYVYDCVLNQEREAHDFGAGVVVDDIRWHDAVLTQRIMHVCVSKPAQSGKNGSIYEMLVAPNGALSVKNAYENVCGQVVSTHWKN